MSSALEIIVLLLFVAFLVSSILRILGMLKRKKAGEAIDRARLLFFFIGCLMLICLVPLGIFDLLSHAIVVSDLAVVGANFIGYALTYDLRLRRLDRLAGEKGEPDLVRTYQVYREGARFGLVTKEGFDVLLGAGLLKRQRTLELVDDFQSRARAKGIRLRILQSREGSQALLQVDAPEFEAG